MSLWRPPSVTIDVRSIDLMTLWGLMGPLSLHRLQIVMARAERIRTQQTKDKNKLYALYAPEVECLSKGKARHPYEFGVKASLAVTHWRGLVVGARTFPGNPYDGHILAAQLEQTSIPARRRGPCTEAGDRRSGIPRSRC